MPSTYSVQHGCTTYACMHTQLRPASLVDDFHLDSLLLYDTLSYSYCNSASSSQTLTWIYNESSQL